MLGLSLLYFDFLGFALFCRALLCIAVLFPGSHCFAARTFTFLCFHFVRVLVFPVFFVFFIALPCFAILGVALIYEEEKPGPQHPDQVTHCSM